jgi:hypothetical protein
MMPRLPEWVVIAVGAVVIAFGLFRLRLALRSAKAHEAARAQGGLIGYPRRTHGLFAIVYILMGALLIMGALGVKMPWMQ